MPETVLVLCAHNDDNIIGAGGTIAKYAKEGKEVYTVVFSYGETSLPHLQEKISIKTRVAESKRAARMLGEKHIYYIGLKEGNFAKEINERNIISRISDIIRKLKPTKIFTHSIDDPHPDHQAVFRFVMQLANHIDFHGHIYSFNVWNFFLNFRKRNSPRLVVDISDTFQIKVDAFKLHRSQKPAIFSLMWSVYLQAIMSGFRYNTKYAEVFFQVK
ncbi:MAG: hypothetical protein HGA85_04300 [Nanoarchaeota archaeon]|nr:hypothetical protein [Nanoarchaeota archaeon]